MSTLNRQTATMAVSLFVGAAFFATDATAAPPPMPEHALDKVPDLPLFTADWNDKFDGAHPGTLKRLPKGDKNRAESGGKVRELSLKNSENISAQDLASQNENASRRFRTEAENEVKFLIYDAESDEEYSYTINRGDLAKASHAVSLEGSTEEGGSASRARDTPSAEEQEDDVAKSWSNSSDQRIRRGTQDGYSDTDTNYQNIVDYGGCSGTIVWSSSTEIVFVTAAHCAHTFGGGWNISNVRPRRNGGTDSPTWGTWEPKVFATTWDFKYGSCRNSWSSSCIKHDIAVVRAKKKYGVNDEPNGRFGWSTVNASTLSGKTKYRRGYPSCSFDHSPDPCSTNHLYGDGAESIGNFSSVDSDGWNRVFRFSSDMNPGDSGSGHYYYSSGKPYVFGVTSAEDTCYENCSSSRPNLARRMTPEWADWINIMIP